ncbi:MAG: transporter substrate-binding protein [Hyphomicrobiales bacterium]|nr:transporter substrate-binding protein [Hyphomicrobiales bacterium]
MHTVKRGTSPLAFTRRAFTLGACTAVLAAAAAATTFPAAAQSDWPNRTVTVIVPFPPGGNTDTQARLLSEHLSKKFGQSFIVDNRPNAGGTIATAQLAKSKPDGYTLMFGSAGQTTILPMVQKVSYDAEKELMPLSIFGTGPFILGAKNDLPAKTMTDLIAYAKANPGKLNIATPNPGSISHLSATLFAKRAGIDLVQVPYKGGGPAVAALLGGEVDLYFGNASELLQYSTGGRLRLMAVSSPEPLKQIPDVPPVAATFPGFKTSSWNGLMAPAGLPKDIAEKLVNATIEASKQPAIIERLTTLGVEPTGSTMKEFNDIVAAERPLYREAVDAAGLKMQN